MKPDRRSIVAVVLTIVILVLFNISIYDREQTIANGETLFLELAPVDPRSLMQGDYMQLRYVIEREAPVEQLEDHERRGYLVIRGDASGVARFVRFHQGEELESNEKLVRFHKQYNRIRIVPDAFFFQEGHAEFFEDARYGVFRFDDRGRHVLVGLADAGQLLIEPRESEARFRRPFAFRRM